MVLGLWGKKIGMTQLFAKDKVVSVTVINTANWYITQIKKKMLMDIMLFKLDI